MGKVVVAETLEIQNMDDVTAVKKQPTHTLFRMISAQRNLLDRAVEDLAALEANFNTECRDLDDHYEREIKAKEEHVSGLMAMMRTGEAELVTLRKEKRVRRDEAKERFDQEAASQRKMISSLRVLLADLEKD